MGGDLINRGIVEFKDVIDELLFLFLNSALFAARVKHHADLFLCDFLVVTVRIDPEQPQQAVGGNGQKPDNGREEL